MTMHKEILSICVGIHPIHFLENHIGSFKIVIFLENILKYYFFRVVRSQPVDLFPQTPHHELVFLLLRGEALKRFEELEKIEKENREKMEVESEGIKKEGEGDLPVTSEVKLEVTQEPVKTEEA